MVTYGYNMLQPCWKMVLKYRSDRATPTSWDHGHGRHGPSLTEALRSALHLQRRNSTAALEAQRWALRREPWRVVTEMVGD